MLAGWEAYGRRWADYGKQFTDMADSFESFEDEEEQFYGPKKITNKQFKQNVTIHGPATLNKVTIKDVLTVNGTLDAQDLKAKEVIVHGPATLDNGIVETVTVYGPLTIDEGNYETLNIAGPLSITNATVSGTASIKGPVASYDTTFEKLRIKNSNLNKKAEVALKSVTADSIEINSKSTKTSILKLDSSTIKGTITFVGERGKVYLSNTKVDKKRIKNADIISSDSEDSADDTKDMPANKSGKTVIVDGKKFVLHEGQSLILKNGTLEIE